MGASGPTTNAFSGSRAEEDNWGSRVSSHCCPRFQWAVISEVAVALGKGASTRRGSGAPRGGERKAGVGGWLIRRGAEGRFDAKSINTGHDHNVDFGRRVGVNVGTRGCRSGTLTSRLIGRRGESCGSVRFVDSSRRQRACPALVVAETLLASSLAWSLAARLMNCLPQKHCCKSSGRTRRRPEVIEAGCQVLEPQERSSLLLLLQSYLLTIPLTATTMHGPGGRDMVTGHSSIIPLSPE